MNALRLALALGCFCLLNGCKSRERQFCEETGACVQMTAAGQVVTQGSVDDCTDQIELTEGLKALIDQCSGEEDCAFVVCICDITESGDEFCDAARKQL